MPTYDYQCSECGHSFEKRQKISDRYKPTEEPCEQCSGVVKMKVGFPIIVSGVKGPNSAPDGFKDVLREIKKGAGKETTIDV